MPSIVLAALCAMLPSVIPFVALWKAYVPAPVRVRKPVDEKPVMLSSDVPLAVEAFVPPLAIPRVPASVTAPVVAELGVNPVVPALKLATVLPVVASVPLVGNVTLVLFESVPVNVYAPENAVLPPTVIVDVPLLTPVPPLAGGTRATLPMTPPLVTVATPAVADPLKSVVVPATESAPANVALWSWSRVKAVVRVKLLFGTVLKTSFDPAWVDVQFCVVKALIAAPLWIVSVLSYVPPH